MFRYTLVMYTTTIGYEAKFNTTEFELTLNNPIVSLKEDELVCSLSKDDLTTMINKVEERLFYPCNVVSFENKFLSALKKHFKLSNKPKVYIEDNYICFHISYRVKGMKSNAHLYIRFIDKF